MSTKTKRTSESASPGEWNPGGTSITDENGIFHELRARLQIPEDIKPFGPTFITWTNFHFVCHDQPEVASCARHWVSILEVYQPVRNRSLLKLVHSWL